MNLPCQNISFSKFFTNNSYSPIDISDNYYQNASMEKIDFPIVSVRLRSQLINPLFAYELETPTGAIKMGLFYPIYTSYKGSV